MECWIWFGPWSRQALRALRYRTVCRRGTKPHSWHSRVWCSNHRSLLLNVAPSRTDFDLLPWDFEPLKCFRNFPYSFSFRCFKCFRCLQETLKILSCKAVPASLKATPNASLQATSRDHTLLTLWTLTLGNTENITLGNTENIILLV